MRSKRYEFSKKIKKAAYERSGGRCEAIGTIYGNRPETRCAAFLGPANVQYDHYPAPATDEGSDTLENCVACCLRCHAMKTANYDIPMQAKGKRIRRKRGPVEDRRRTKAIPSRQSPMPSRPFQKRVK